MKRVLPAVVDIGGYQCRIIHQSQELARNRCRFIGHSSNNDALCGGFRKDQNVHTIRSVQNPLCNFYPCNVNVYDRTFDSSEQAYQWCFIQHLGRDDLAEKILTAAKAKEVASRVPQHLHGTWHDVKLDIMNEILRAKVRCCPEFKTALIQSAEKELVEAVRSDRFWSCGLSPRDATLTKSSFYPGENNLGRILEDIRDSLTPDLEILEKELNKNDDHDDSEQTSAPEPLPKMTSSYNQEHSATTLDGDKKAETSNKFRVSTGTYSVSVCSASATDPAITPASPQELDSGIPPTTTSPPSTPAPFQSSESDHNSSQNTDMKKKIKLSLCQISTH